MNEEGGIKGNLKFHSVLDFKSLQFKLFFFSRDFQKQNWTTKKLPSIAKLITLKMNILMLEKVWIRLAAIMAEIMEVMKIRQNLKKAVCAAASPTARRTQ